ncbi:HAD family hydrolase [Brevibacterium litoralis]|uniref:HAD family hydrolase n=1 Tax=Brevibacterium litoralis TaxID=3138935 RepID=UPI0032EEFF8E
MDPRDTLLTSDASTDTSVSTATTTALSYSAVLWDMDGTLVDTEHYWMEAIDELMTAHGLSWSEEQQLLMVGNDLITSARILIDHGLEMEAEVIVETLLDGVSARVAEHVPFRPGAQELLAALREAEVPCVLVTMSYRRLAETVLEAVPSGTFRGIVAGDDVTHGKPHPEPYLAGAALLGLDPAACVGLEDSVPGITSAVAAGTRAVGIPHDVALDPPADPEHPDRVLIDTLAGVTPTDLDRITAPLV